MGTAHVIISVKSENSCRGCLFKGTREGLHDSVGCRNGTLWRVTREVSVVRVFLEAIDVAEQPLWMGARWAQTIGPWLFTLDMTGKRPLHGAHFLPTYESYRRYQALLAACDYDQSISNQEVQQSRGAPSASETEGHNECFVDYAFCLRSSNDERTPCSAAIHVYLSRH